MNHTLLKSVIYDQHEFIRNFQIVPRNYEFEENGNYVLVGLRRAGKSTLLYKIVLDLVASGVDWDQIIYINFEDERLSLKLFLARIFLLKKSMLKIFILQK